ncbi:UNVERIFIED_CONTAM: hypothetical protein Sindi_1296300 [Sesamum indicum]
MQTPTGDGGEAPAGDVYGGEDTDSRPVAGDGGEEEEQSLFREEEHQLAMEEEDPASTIPATEGDSHGSPRSVEAEGALVKRNGEEMGGEQPDLELTSRAVNNGGNRSSSPRDFNLDEFLTLVHKVIDHGDSQAMDALKELKRRWEARFGIGKSQLPTESLNVDDNPFARELRQACRRRTTPATTILGTGMAATFQRRPAVRGRIITSSPPAMLHSNNANHTSPAASRNANQISPAALHSRNANQISPATVGIPTKDDVLNVADMDA